MFYNITERGLYVGKDGLAKKAFLQILGAVEYRHSLLQVSRRSNKDVKVCRPGPARRRRSIPPGALTPGRAQAHPTNQGRLHLRPGAAQECLVGRGGFSIPGRETLRRLA